MSDESGDHFTMKLTESLLFSDFELTSYLPVIQRYIEFNKILNIVQMMIDCFGRGKYHSNTAEIERKKKCFSTEIYSERFLETNYFCFPK